MVIPLEFYYLTVLGMLCFGAVAVASLSVIAVMALRLLGQADERIYHSTPVYAPPPNPAHQHPALQPAAPGEGGAP